MRMVICGVELFQGRRHHRRFGWRKSGRRLVQKNYRGVRNEGQGDLNLSLLPMRKILDDLSPLRRDPHLAQNLVRPAVKLPVGGKGPHHLELHALQTHGGDDQVVQHAQRREKSRDLKGSPQPQRGSPMAGHARDLPAEEPDHTGGDRVEPADQAE